MSDNRVSVVISTEDKQKIQAAIKVLQDTLEPLLLQLDAEDRKTLFKMGDKTVAFVYKAYEHSQRNPELAPKYFNFSEMKKDMDAVTDLRQIVNPLEQLVQSLNDTMMLAGSEALNEAMVFYTAVKGAAKAKIGSSEHIYNDLSSRFPAKNKKKKEE
jgi:hypothetical protein